MSAAVELTIRNQIAAADPAISAFVAANAGSGKTRVLTNRVARLLLAGALPEKILCITYTKAAAAEMAARLSELLGDWALSDDDSLSKSLCALEGSDPNKRHYSDQYLSRARRLFARALETPGGLKIQTIHAFCETVLKRFPLEAGVPPGFEIAEDAQASSLIDRAMDKVARRAKREPVLASAFNTLGTHFSPKRLTDLLRASVRSRQAYHQCRAHYQTDDAIIGALANGFGINVKTTIDQIHKDIVATISHDTACMIIQNVEVGGPRAVERTNFLSEYMCTDENDIKINALRSYFLNADGTPNKQLLDKPIKTAHPEFEADLNALQLRIFTLFDQLKSVVIVNDTRHFLTLNQAITLEYDALKLGGGVLDFDDLILRTQSLFGAGEHAVQWVMYKLDAGLDHILVDETQDTSPGQWDVIESPLQEFFVGESARSGGRSFFAVGDQKQSIYSFQGADAGLFDEKQMQLGAMISATSTFKNVPLTLSFRSTAPVLGFVDALFAPSQAKEGLGSDIKLEHGVRRTQAGGLVEVWPYVPKPDKVEIDPWDMPLDAIGVTNPVVQLCDQVAATIANWLSDPVAILESAGRQIEPGDIIILVQTRGAPFRQIIKSLTKHNVPVAGADRLNLVEDIAILDLLSYARICLLREDDLSLAELLKSPFFNVDEETLFALAHYRPEGASLWSALSAAARDNEIFKVILAEIVTARHVGLHQGPYAFFTHLLDSGQPSGRKRLFARLGIACRETIDALIAQALKYEESHPRTLQGFVTWFEANAGEIKREPDQASKTVRVMTVHGAKGLEGNIVFLIDATRKPNSSKDGPLSWVSPAGSKYDAVSNRDEFVPALVRSTTERSDLIKTNKDEDKKLQYEEYRRLLYVAATRAADRLYICAAQTKSAPDIEKKQFTIGEASWYELAMLASERLKGSDTESIDLNDFPWKGNGTRFFKKQTGLIKPASKDTGSVQPDRATDLSWMKCQARNEQPRLVLLPSRLADDFEQRDILSASAIEPEGFSPIDTDDRFERGRTLHRLLELLPDHPIAERSGRADRMLEQLAGDISTETRNRWRDEVLAILNDPIFAAVFGPGSRAEVSIGGSPPGIRESAIINGQIDRLIITDTQILIVDYKTNQPPPQSEQNVAAVYIAQMAAYRALLAALYPGRAVKTALLWTWDARLMELSDEILDHAFARYLAAS